MASYKDMGEKITAMVINAVNNGESLPWVKPWKGGKSFFTGGAISYATGKPYSLLNQFFLGGEGVWITAAECKKKGISFAGHKARRVFFGSMVKTTKKDERTGEDKVVTYPMYKEFNVFNCKELGIETKWDNKNEDNGTQMSTTIAIPHADALIFDYVLRSGITFKNNVNSDRAFYSPGTDMVVVPNKEQFPVIEEYYSTTFHEFTHSTLTTSRCNRPDTGLTFGDKGYAKEELVAELGSCMILASLGINTATTERNSAAYLKSWLKALQEDTSMLLWALNRAEKAFNFITNASEEATKVEVA